MRISVKSAAVLGLTLIAGIVAGGILGAREADRVHGEMVHALVLSQASSRAVQLTKLLQAVQEKKQDLAADRMEFLLSQAVVDIGREYSPSRDYYGAATLALRLANEYRAAHPHKHSSDYWDKETEAALATKTAPIPVSSPLSRAVSNPD